MIDVPPFDLTANPFHVLDVSRGTPSAALTAAYEHGLRVGRRSESELRAALQALRDPETRLQAELSWFLYQVPEKWAALMERLDARDYSTCSEALDDLVDIDRVNLAAHLCSVGAGSLEYADWAVAGYQTVDPSTAAPVIAKHRAAAEFPELQAAMLIPALGAVRSAHVKAVLHWLQSQPDPVNQMLAITQLMHGDDDEWFEAQEHPLTTMAFAELACGCEPWMSPALDHVRKEIAEQLALHREGMDGLVLIGCAGSISPVFRTLSKSFIAERDLLNVDLDGAEHALSRIGKMFHRLAALAEKDG